MGLDERINAGIPAYEEALKKAGVKYEVIIYPGVNHAFHNNTSKHVTMQMQPCVHGKSTLDFFEVNLNSKGITGVYASSQTNRNVLIFLSFTCHFCTTCTGKNRYMAERIIDEESFTTFAACAEQSGQFSIPDHLYGDQQG
jgi:hypothetical protein